MKKMLKKETINSEKGITLIVLVITIVVLIILAGVAINLSLGNNGILNRAKTAKGKYQNAQEYEETEIAKVTNEIDSHVDGNRDTVTIPREEYERLKNNITYSTEEKAIGTWIDGKTIYQKTYTDLNVNPGSTWVEVANDTTTANMETVIDCIAIGKARSNSNYKETFTPFCSLQNGSLRIYASDGWGINVNQLIVSYTNK